MTPTGALGQCACIGKSCTYRQGKKWGMFLWSQVSQGGSAQSSTAAPARGLGIKRMTQILEGEVSKVAQQNSHFENTRGSDTGPLQLRVFCDPVMILRSWITGHCSMGRYYLCLLD